MVEKKIKALIDFQFTNFTGTHFLVAGEVKRIKFINQRRFEQHVQSGRMVEADLHEKEDKIIPVVFPPQSEEIISVDPVDPIDPPQGIEPDKPDLPYPRDEAGEPEEQMTLEDERRSESPIELVPEEVKEFEPNAETVEAVEELENGENPVFETAEELIEELNEGDVPESTN